VRGFDVRCGRWRGGRRPGGVGGRLGQRQGELSRKLERRKGICRVSPFLPSWRAIRDIRWQNITKWWKEGNSITAPTNTVPIVLGLDDTAAQGDFDAVNTVFRGTGFGNRITLER
jgi:hypothetical protein